MSRPTQSHKGLGGWLRRVLQPATPEAPATPPVNSLVVTRRDASAIVVTDGANDGANDNGSEGAYQTYDPEATAQAWRRYCPPLAPYALAIGLSAPEMPEHTREQRVLAQQLIAALSVEEIQAGESLGSAPTHALQVLKLVSRLDLEASQLTAAVANDPAITAALLRASNSAATAGANGAIDSVRDAITRLGVLEAARIAGAVAAQTLFSPSSRRAQEQFGKRLTELHVTAASVAFGASKLSNARNVGRAELAYLAGMLQDVGKTLALTKLAQLIDVGVLSVPPDDSVLDRVLDAVHVELGSLAHRTWCLPDPLLQLCESQDQHAVTAASNVELHVVRVASGLLALRERTLPPARAARIAESLVALRIKPADLRALDETLLERAKQVRGVLTR